MRYFDAHSHLQFPMYDADRDEVLARMQELDMGSLVIGTDLATSRAGVALAEKYDFLWAAIGLHPNDNLEEQFDEEAFTTLAQHEKVVAIGECGLDYFRSGETAEEREAQLKRFEAHVRLALLVNKPLIIHCRDAHEDMLVTLAAHLRDHPQLQVVIHFFTGSKELARRYLDLGCHLSFPGPITFTDMYDESVRATPLEKLLIETDAPFAAPAPHRGKRNEPAFVVEVGKKVATLKGLEAEEVAKVTVQNAQNLFSLR